ncbi:hypothetical protein IGB42_03177 [Andreprevotia sp. IGB-42]|nr:hypothetical protein IGB42_03177 [Andreprevotia sp. IGB-42]
MCRICGLAEGQCIAIRISRGQCAADRGIFRRGDRLAVALRVAIAVDQHRYIVDGGNTHIDDDGIGTALAIADGDGEAVLAVIIAGRGVGPVAVGINGHSAMGRVAGLIEGQCIAICIGSGKPATDRGIFRGGRRLCRAQRRAIVVHQNRGAIGHGSAACFRSLRRRTITECSVLEFRLAGRSRAADIGRGDVLADARQADEGVGVITSACTTAQAGSRGFQLLRQIATLCDHRVHCGGIGRCRAQRCVGSAVWFDRQELRIDQHRAVRANGLHFAVRQQQHHFAIGGGYQHFVFLDFLTLAERGQLAGRITQICLTIDRNKRGVRSDLSHQKIL